VAWSAGNWTATLSSSGKLLGHGVQYRTIAS
jgi:hypothetical protein